MMNTSLQTPNHHIQDRSAINAMTAEWIAKNGEPRRFDRGFSSDWLYLQRLMDGFGYKIAYYGKRFFSIERKDVKGNARKVVREEFLHCIDAVLIENGKQPFGWRK
jgi:hypothetical protein